LNQTLSREDSEKIKKGRNPLARNRASLLTPHRANVGLAGLRQIPYPRVIGLAGLGRVTAQVTGLRHFPYPGAIRLTGLGQVMARVTGLARVKLRYGKTSPRGWF
jgi:hypothetical protein